MTVVFARGGRKKSYEWGHNEENKATRYASHTSFPLLLRTAPTLQCSDCMAVSMPINDHAIRHAKTSFNGSTVYITAY